MPHQNINKIRKELVDLLEGGNAHMTFEEAVAEFPLSRINDKGPHLPYSPWHFLEHLRIAQWDILEFIRNPLHVSPEYPSGYRPPADATTDEQGWNTTVEGFRRDLGSLVTMASDPAMDLFAPLSHAPGYTLYREFLLVADHNAYHIGEFALLRQMMGLWPSHLPYLTGKPD